MRIQHNIPAMNAYRNYSANTSALSKNLEKLSSGYRINRAGDDAAGLAISEKMRAQITGLKTAQKNAKDGISLVQTAEGALTEVHDMLNRMVELAEQSANGTYDNTTDRANLQKEIDQLRSEIDRIADSANFNGINLLDGSLSNAAGVQTSTGTVMATTTVAPVAPATLQALGTLGSGADGILPESTGEVKYQATVFVGGTITAGATDMTITIGYTDNLGSAQTVTIKVSAGVAVTMGQIATMLSNGTTAGMGAGISYNDTGTSINTGTSGFTAASGGDINDLFKITVDGSTNTLKFEAITSDGTLIGTGGSAFNAVSAKLTGIDISDDAKYEQYIDPTITAGGASNGTTIGVSIVKERDFEAAGKDLYKYGYNEFTVSLPAEGTVTGAEALHNAGISANGQLFLLNVTDGTGLNTVGITGVKFGGTAAAGSFVTVNISKNDTADQIAQKLAEAINLNSTAGPSADDSIQVSVSGATLMFKDTPQGGNNAVSSSTATSKNNLFQLSDANSAQNITNAVSGTYQATVTSTITIDTTKLKNGTTIKMNVGGTEKSFYLTNSADDQEADGTVRVQYGENATQSEILTALKDKLTSEFSSVSGVGTFSVNGSQIVYTDTVTSNVSEADAKSQVVNAVFGNDAALGSGLILQIGDTAQSFNRLAVNIGDMHCDSLGIDKAVMSIADPDSAANAIEKIKNAINQVSSVRGTLGATQNRLDHTINNLSVMTENIQDAESSIRDVDVAEEMMAYTKNNILVQSAQAMLAQANQLPQGVLQLLQ